MSKRKTIIPIAISALMIYAVYLYYREVPIDPVLDAEATRNSPECWYEAEPLDMDMIYTKKEIDEGAKMSRACWEAKVKYIRQKEKMTHNKSPQPTQ